VTRLRLRVEPGTWQDAGSHAYVPRVGRRNICASYSGSMHGEHLGSSAKLYAVIPRLPDNVGETQITVGKSDHGRVVISEDRPSHH